VEQRAQPTRGTAWDSYAETAFLHIIDTSRLWTLFQKYQIATLDREKQLGYVTDYQVFRPGEHVSEDSRWDYRIIITYPNYDGSKREGEVEAQLFPDRAALARDENRRWELTLNHWDLPIRQIDPHEDRE